MSRNSSASSPHPLVYGADSREVLADHIVAICCHPTRDLLGVGDIVGKITLYEDVVFACDDLLSIFHVVYPVTLTVQVKTATK